jgi:exo-beta-1,3-glucanase (GH17 family)
MLSLGHNSNTGSATALGASSGGVMGALGGLVGRSGSAGAQYGPVQTPGYDLGREGEKSEWLAQQKSNKKKWAWIIGIIATVVILGAVGGGVAYALISKKNSSSTPTNTGGQSASSDIAANGDLNKDSAEIKALLGNKNLHKVFPGVDYTPINCQYPDCLHNPPSQNNVTRDLAVLSQMTNTLRLYGTDCNQTEMVLHSIDQLGLNGTMKIWLGVWQDKNTTTNARQLSQMYKVLEHYGTASFLGVVIGNEAIFRQDLTVAALGTLVSAVKANFTALGYKLPVATSDIGVSWTQDLANVVDYIMANIHPFFAGVPADTSASWTWSFWQNSIWPLKQDLKKNIISETGWPSGGGTDCGGAATCTNGAVAGVTEMNRFMTDFVCQALTNGTQYFMFEAFDEPWKVSFNEAGKEWEDKWGLMDVNRNLKSGISIPDCGGKTVPSL